MTCCLWSPPSPVVWPFVVLLLSGFDQKESVWSQTKTCCWKWARCTFYASQRLIRHTDAAPGFIIIKPNLKSVDTLSVFTPEWCSLSISYPHKVTQDAQTRTIEFNLRSGHQVPLDRSMMTGNFAFICSGKWACGVELWCFGKSKIEDVVTDFSTRQSGGHPKQNIGYKKAELLA